MQSMYTPPKAGKIALRYGLIFGLIQAIVASSILLANTFVNTTPDQIGISLLLVGVSFLVGLAAYFVAGIFAAKQTSKVSTGTFAGMWTGAVYGIIDFIVALALFFQVNLPKLLNTIGTSPAASASPDAFKTGTIIGGVGGAIFGILFAIGLGAGLGALGGLIGKSTSKVQPIPATLAHPAYPGQPIPFTLYPQPTYAEQPYMEQPGSISHAEQPQ
ncbi:MAG: hypothetical protein ACRDHZ_24105 [Ktedonobacteraceae bacterium]